MLAAACTFTGRSLLIKAECSHELDPADQASVRSDCVLPPEKNGRGVKEGVLSSGYLRERQARNEVKTSRSAERMVAISKNVEMKPAR